MYIQVTLLCIGLATITQAVFGHRLPSTKRRPAASGSHLHHVCHHRVTLFGSESETLRVLEFSLILCGVFGFILNMLGVIEKLEKYFTPTVVGTNLLLLVALCSKFFFQAMTSVYGDGYGMNLEGGALLRCHHRTDLFPDEHPVSLFRPDQYRGGLGPLHAAGTVHPMRCRHSWCACQEFSLRTTTD